MCEGVISLEHAVAEMIATRTQPAATRRMTEPEFEALYRRTARPLWAYIYRLCGDRSASDDIFQKTFFQFLRAPLREGSEEQLRGFLFRIATNATMDFWRERKKSVGVVSPDESTEFGRQDDRGFSVDMGRVWSELSSKEKTLLWLAHVEGTGHRQIAASLNVKEKSVKVLLFRARKRLAELLSRKGLAPEVRR